MGCCVSLCRDFLPTPPSQLVGLFPLLGLLSLASGCSLCSSRCFSSRSCWEFLRLVSLPPFLPLLFLRIPLLLPPMLLEAFSGSVTSSPGQPRAARAMSPLFQPLSPPPPLLQLPPCCHLSPGGFGRGLLLHQYATCEPPAHPAILLATEPSKKYLPQSQISRPEGAQGGLRGGQRGYHESGVKK